MHNILQIGSRPGWPGTTLAQYVTHAVYRIRSPFSRNGLKYGYVKGYGKPNSQGLVVLDRATVENPVYQWYDPEIYINDNAADFFEDRVSFHSGQFYYTGVGGNCYTPIVLALGDLRGHLVANHANPGDVTDLDRILQILLGSNYGMGTKITNTHLGAGLAAFITGGLAFAITYYMTKKN